jgi:hypothetical protein
VTKVSVPAPPPALRAAWGSRPARSATLAHRSQWPFGFVASVEPEWMTAETGGRQARPWFWWSYAPLIAFLISVWPGIQAADLFFGLLYFAGNMAFVVLFHVTREKIREARLPLGSVKAAMWSSLVIMLIVPYIIKVLMFYGAHKEHLEFWMMSLMLQPLFLPVLGLIGWFAGRGFSRLLHVHRQPRRTK